MVKIGMMIGERYEILEKIGTGGMSDVYKAKCHKLNRYVAVKVLKQEFSENANFVSKFKIEAQAAAGLMHPNIVNVYDVGEENGIHYIVMELVEGITLKKYIEKKARLSYKEAVSIAIQVSMGIEAAHNNHIIHRDIKPQNIIISKDGKVKVTDFGIAKAATSNTITSNVMGSVHYTSPEQARGGYSDEKSDIYSLGVTMFEMLTGRVPFNGETTVAIAIKHIQEEMPSPREYVGEIPAAVESIVLKCCQKSPDRRYQNMQELIADLKQSLISPDEDFVMVHDSDSEGNTRMMSENDMAEIKRHAVYRDNRVYNNDYQEHMRLKSDTMDEGEEEPGEEEDYDYDYNPRMEKVTTILAIVAGLVICVIVIVLAVRLFGNLSESPEQSRSPIAADDESSDVEYRSMPRVTGINLEDAKKALLDIGMKPEIEYEDSDTIDVGVVISANVTVGTQLAPGSVVVLTVSAGAAGVEVPELTGDTSREADTRLTALGFVVNEMSDYSDTVEEGRVISQSPESGTKAPKGSVITITVSKGRQEEKVRVPNLVGMTEEDGTVLAVESKLSIGNVSYVYTNEAEAGYICYQSYSQGSYVDEGTAIDIKVSQGAERPTYKYSGSIEAPTIEEAPDFVAGSEVRIQFITDDGQVLLDTRVTSFPQSANYYGLTAGGGVITMSYMVTLPGETTMDPVTGEAVTTPGATQERAFTRMVTFEKE
ncbi:MAG: Stk1 family PASTA domain-containing Ser/Thr kinase [Roseburia sp.]|nr:Stk1 family PASTA domain-containing Ser/Thr kinase [Roseburia sp.]